MKQIVIATFIWLITSCSPEGPLDEGALKAYLLDPGHGVIQEKKVGKLTVKAQYQPTDLLVTQELGTGVKSDKDLQKKLERKYAAYHYFIVSIANEGNDALEATKADPAYFSEVLQNLSFRMGQFVSLTTSGQDTIPVADFAYPRMYGSSKSTTLMFAFSKETINQGDWVQLNLTEFGLGTGKLKFRFQEKDLNQIPKMTASITKRY